MSKTKVLHQEITNCWDCPLCDHYSIQCINHSRCTHSDGKAFDCDGTKDPLFGIDIPDWCPLPDKKEEAP